MRWWTSCISVCEYTQTHVRVHAHTRTNPHQYAIIVPWPFTLTVYWLWPEGPIKRHQLYRPNGNVSWLCKNTHAQPPTPTHTHAGTSTLTHRQRDTNNNNYCLEICSPMQKTDQLIADLQKHVFLHVHSNESQILAVRKHHNNPSAGFINFHHTSGVFFVFASHLTVTKIWRVRWHLLFIYSKIPRYTHFCESLFFTPVDSSGAALHG